MLIIFPKEILNIILQYDGRIKYKNGKYMNQININDEKYNLLNYTISKKASIIKKIKVRIDGTFYYNIPLCNNIYGYMYWHDKNIYIISFYKNPCSLIKYKFVDIYFKFLNLYDTDLPISIYEYK